MQTRHPHDRPACARSRSGLALGLSLLFAAGPVLAQGNPLTEVPGRAPPAGALPVDAAPPVEAASRDAAGEREEAGATNPSATAIIRSLAPFADGNPGAPPLAVDPGDGGPTVRVDAARAVDLTVFFAYDSARLTPEARVQLEPLGQALQARELAGRGFLIAGHTDAAGALGHNRRLSLARARAVKVFLVEAYGIDPDRLRLHGWGSTRLKVPGAPRARINRRVEVSLIARQASGWRLGPAEGSCRAAGLADPRRRVALDLDDFDAAPSAVACAD